MFASICDKLFDIDEKLNIVPQLALSHETSEDGKEVTIKLRPSVKFHDGEKLDAEAAKYSLERHLTMQGSFRKPEIAAIDSVEVVDPLTIRLKLKAPFSPLIAQLTDRAGMMVSPKAAKEAGDKFGLKPVCAGPYKFVERVQQDRIVVEKFADYWDKANVHIDRIVYQPVVDSTIRLANLKSGGLDLIERLLATDIKEVRADSRLQARDRARARLSGPDDEPQQRREGEEPARAEPEGAPGAQPRDRSRRPQSGRVQRRVRAGQPMGQSRASVLPEGLSGAEARRRQGQGAAEGGGRHHADHARPDGAEQSGDAAGRGGDPGDGGARPAST